MTDLELIFTMLGEASTTEIAKKRNALGFPENKRAAKDGGSVAGKARRDLEKQSGKRISTPENFNALPEANKRITRKNHLPEHKPHTNGISKPHPQGLPHPRRPRRQAGNEVLEAMQYPFVRSEIVPLYPES